MECIDIVYYFNWPSYNCTAFNLLNIKEQIFLKFNRQKKTFLLSEKLSWALRSFSKITAAAVQVFNYEKTKSIFFFFILGSPRAAKDSSHLSASHERKTFSEWNAETGFIHKNSQKAHKFTCPTELISFDDLYF